MPLSQEEYAPGRRVTLSGETLDVYGEVITTEATRFLIVGQPDSHIAVMVSAAALAENGEAVDPEEADQQRQQESNRQAEPQEAVTPDTSDTPQAQGNVTGATDVTGPQDTPATAPTHPGQQPA